MLENWRDLIPYRSNNRFGNVVLSLFFLSAVIFTVITINLDKNTSFHCDPDKSVAGGCLNQKIYVESSCSLKYEQKHNSPIPLRGFVLLNFGLILAMCIIYAYSVNTRIKGYDTPASTRDDVELQPLQQRLQPLQQRLQPDQEVQTRTHFSVFNIYVFHLLLRIVVAIVFTVLMFSAEFPTKFSCPCPSSNSNITVSGIRLNGTTMQCTNSVGLERTNSTMAVGIVNILLIIIALVEILYLLCQIWLDKDFGSDLEFCCVYLLGKRKRISEILKQCKNELNKCGVFEMEMSFGKTSKKKLKEMYVKLIIREGRACEMPEFREMGRHEIYRTHLNSAEISIKEIEDMFLSRGNDGKLPHKFMVVGRPAIGKSVLAKKILLNWCEELHEFYGGKLAILLKFRTFNSEENRCCSLRDMLKLGIGLPVDKLGALCEYVLANPERVLLIFDGLDELRVDSSCLTEEDGIPDDYNKAMSAFSLFRKLVSGRFLPGATVITTARPTADCLYSQLNFDQTYEVLGFTEEKIQDYVMKFCGENDIGTRVWSYIKETAELLSICCIPVSCFIACLTLVECIKAEDCKDRQSSVNEDLPKTLTELYKRAIRIILWNHHPACSSQMKVTDYLYSDDRFPDEVKFTLENLTRVAYTGIEQRKLIFDLDTDEENCGLLNSLPNERKPLYCFLHLTIQEYLAAKELVDKTSSPGDVEEFLLEHIEDGNWHLVIQFYAGLLRDKFTEVKFLVDICKSFVDWIPPIAMWQESEERTLLMIKCLHELQDDDIIKQAAAKLDGGGEQECSLRGMGIAPVDCAALFHLLIYVKNLVSLDISDNNLGDSGYLELVKSLEQKSLANSDTDDKLTGLNLTYTNITQRGVQYLAHVLTNQYCKLTNLNLGHNAIGDEGVKHLCDSLKFENCKLTNLDLWKNAVGDEGVKYLSDALKNENCKLTNLVLASNAIGAEGAIHLSDALRNENCKLTNLDLECNVIGDEGAKHVCEALRNENCKLTILNFAWNALGVESAIHLSDALKNENCKLTNLYIV